jgi:acyl carrier protein phosphodiesterase
LNFLAHLALSGEDTDLMIGNFIADFVKGKKALETYPASIQKGIFLHRKIDNFTDTHYITNELVEILRTQASRYAGVVIDILYDHFLAVHFEKFFSEKLEDFAQKTYITLFENFKFLPERLQEMLPYMQKENWLVKYGDGENKNFYGLQRSLEGLQKRSSHTGNFLLCIDVLQKNYAEFNDKSLVFLADVKEFAEEIKALKQD